MLQFFTILLIRSRSAAAALAADGTSALEATDKAGSTHSQPASKPQSPTTTPEGTPPISPNQSPSHGKTEQFPDVEDLKAVLPGTRLTPAPAPGPQSQSKSFSRPRPQPASRQASKGGGVQMVLDEHGSWTSLADQSATLPADATANKEAKDSGSVLGFLRGKKGRDRSPKPKEAGVLGKAGARQILS